METSFLRYFFKFIFWGKGKQKTLILALLGLSLSSFALFVLQSSMGGLQRNLINRGKRVEGTGVIELLKKEKDFALKFNQVVKNLGYDAFPEYEMELLLKNSSYIAPVIIHALNLEDKNNIPSFLKDSDFESGVIGADLAQKLHVSYRNELTLISPSHTNVMLSEIPRFVTTVVSDIIRTEVPEVDMFHYWMDADTFFNLIRAEEFNVIRIFSPFDKNELTKKLQEKFPEEGIFKVKTWEDQNESLVWALNLETTVMISLFVAMTILVGLAITSGLLIFFNRIQTDIVSFWMLGMSKKKIERLSIVFVNLLGFMAAVLGLIFGFIFLFLLEKYSGILMPDVFIEKKIPVFMTFKGMFISLLIPYGLSQLFAFFSLREFRKDQRTFIAQLRSN